jgi:hypothetical protein
MFLWQLADICMYKRYLVWKCALGVLVISGGCDQGFFY